MQWSIVALAAIMLAAPAAAHGALIINEFDTYAISDFEGHEDSFAWEGFEIWDVYAGDGFSTELDSHGVYFKINFAGDGTLRPLLGTSWDVTVAWTLGNESFERSFSHDGNGISTDFESFESQIADGNVLQVHAWAPVTAWEGQEIADLVVTSSVDGDLRDVAPGGIYVPVVGAELPVNLPPLLIFPEMGEGRIVETVPLTGPAKFVEVQLDSLGFSSVTFNVSNPMAEQGQHIYVEAEGDGWTVDGSPQAFELDGGMATDVNLKIAPGDGTVEPLPIHISTDVGGLRTVYAYMTDQGIAVTENAAEAKTYHGGDVEESPGIGILVLGAVVVAAIPRRR